MKKREKSKTLFRNKNVTIKEIVSPRSFTSGIFFQKCDEYVFLLHGSAHMNIEGKKVLLKRGDDYVIQRGVTHQILKTSPKTETVWLCVYIK